MSKKSDASTCAECGASGPPAEYHPLAFCVLVKALGSGKSARFSLNEVLDHGRALERAGLPNNASITALDDKPTRKRRK